MANTLKIFDARPAGFQQVCIYQRTSVLEMALASDSEIDGFICQLKLDLDAAAVIAKRVLATEQEKPIFDKC